MTVSSPEVPGDPKQVTVTGRVRGDIDIGNDENGEINFSSFPGRTGKRMTISLQSDVPGLTLEFDRKRTPEFLTAVLGKPEKINGEARQVWSLRAEVIPGKMWGSSPPRRPALRGQRHLPQGRRRGQTPAIRTDCRSGDRKSELTRLRQRGNLPTRRMSD